MHIPAKRRWQLKTADVEAVANISTALNITPLVARLLVNRGISTPEEARCFLEPSLVDLSDPFLMKGVAAAVDRLIVAWKAKETVCIHGDYDVDGVTAVALLTAFFQAVSLPVCHVIPRRLEDGYGLSTDGVDEAFALGATVLVTVDCGITSVREAEYCRSRGVDLIITDHHTPGEVIPDATAVINPLQPGCGAPFRSFAGVGLAFKLAMALRSRMRTEGCFTADPEPNLREYLDFTSLGTIADLVPLLGENRIIAAFGLKELTRSRNAGIIALKRVSAVRDEVTAGDVGFRLAPRLNAAGRLDDAKRGVELLLTTDTALAENLAHELDAANGERQEIEREILSDALRRLQTDDSFQGRTAIVMASTHWHPGVIGIVASRIVERYHRPTLLIALQGEEGKGSGRSIPAFNLYNALAASSTHLLKFGGHRQAAGLAVAARDLPVFYDTFDAHAAAVLLPDDLVPVITVDAEIDLTDFDDTLLADIDRLRPFGMGNPEPVFLLREIVIVETRILKEAHLKLKLRSGAKTVDALGFNMAGRDPGAGPVDILCTLDRNEWNGRITLQLKLKDIRPSGEWNGA